jgi:hypothetical protein
MNDETREHRLAKAQDDLAVRAEGSLYLLTALTDRGEAWIAEHIPEDAQTWCGAIVVEHRYIRAIVEGARNDGLSVR